MTPRFAKVIEIAEKYRVSPDAVYLWIRQGKIPADCVVRIAGTVRVDEEQFEKRLRSGTLCQRRGRKPVEPNDLEASRPLTRLIADDSFTTVGKGPNVDHRWTDESGTVKAGHPFGPELLGTTK